MKKNINLQSRLAIILMLVSLIPFITVCLVFKSKLTSLQQKSLLEGYERDFHSVEQYLKDQEIVLTNQISTIAMEPVMQEVLANDTTGQIKNFIEKLKADNSLFQEILVTSEKSAIITATSSEYNEYMKDILQVTGYKESRVRKEVIHHAKMKMIKISTPIYAAYSQDTCIGFLVVFLNNDYLNEIFNKFQISQRDNTHLIYAVVDSENQDLLYSNTNLINSYNYNLLATSNKLSNIQIANNDFIFSKFPLKTDLMHDAKVYIGMLKAFAHKNNAEFNKLFELTIPLIVVAQLVAIFLISNFFNKWITGAAFSANRENDKTNELPAVNSYFDEERTQLTNMIDKILSLVQVNEESSLGTNYIDQVKKEMQQINLYLFNVRLELAKSQIHNDVINNLLEQMIAKIKQLQESPLHGEGLTLNAEKIKLNNLLQKLSSQVAAIFK